MQYDPEEIRKWKKLIYGTHMVSTQVDDWVSNGQDTRKNTRRKSGAKKYGGSMPKFGSSNTGSNNDSFSNSSYSQDDWVHSPGTAKRTYKYK